MANQYENWARTARWMEEGTLPKKRSPKLKKPIEGFFREKITEGISLGESLWAVYPQENVPEIDIAHDVMFKNPYVSDLLKIYNDIGRITAYMIKMSVGPGDHRIGNIIASKDLSVVKFDWETHSRLQDDSLDLWLEKFGDFTVQAKENAFADYFEFEHYPKSGDTSDMIAGYKNNIDELITKLQNSFNRGFIEEFEVPLEPEAAELKYRFDLDRYETLEQLKKEVDKWFLKEIVQKSQLKAPNIAVEALNLP